MDTASHVEYWWWGSEWYLIYVREDASRKLSTAETQLGPGDRVISDGRSVEDALQMHWAVLPLALCAREHRGRVGQGKGVEEQAKPETARSCCVTLPCPPRRRARSSLCHLFLAEDLQHHSLSRSIAHKSSQHHQGTDDD